MTKTTKIIGWIVLALTEILISVAFYHASDLVPLVAYQVVVFGVVWGSVNVKNALDVKREVGRFGNKSGAPSDPGEYRGG